MRRAANASVALLASVGAAPLLHRALSNLLAVQSTAQYLEEKR